MDQRLGGRRGSGAAPEGSLFLNVGAKPTDPWTALDVAQAVRPHLRLQNIIHWVKSIAIERSAAGSAAGLTRDLAVGHYKPINSDRFLNDVTSSSSTSLRSAKPPGAAGPWGPLPGPIEHRPLAGSFRRRALPREHVVHSRTRRFSAAIATARIRRPFRRGCRNSACACTG
jgi:hypothetical protein